MNKAAFLDRDGVLIKSNVIDGTPIAVRHEDDVVLLGGVSEAVEILLSKNFLPVVITNQPEVSRGNTTLIEVNAINRKIYQETGIKHFYVCLHSDEDNCNCRKPKPGLIEKALQDLDLNLESCFLVGDRWKDINLGNDLGMRSYFIDYSYREKGPNPPFIRVNSLLEAVEHFVGGQ